MSLGDPPTSVSPALGFEIPASMSGLFHKCWGPKPKDNEGVLVHEDISAVPSWESLQYPQVLDCVRWRCYTHLLKEYVTSHRSYVKMQIECSPQGLICQRVYAGEWQRL